MIKANTKLKIQFVPEHNDEETSKACPGMISGTISQGILPSPSPKPKTKSRRHITIDIGSNCHSSKIGIDKENNAIVISAERSSDLRPNFSIKFIDTIVETKFISDIKSVSLTAVSGL